MELLAKYRYQLLNSIMFLLIMSLSNRNFISKYLSYDNNSLKQIPGKHINLCQILKENDVATLKCICYENKKSVRTQKC